MSGAEHPRSSAFIGGFKGSSFHFSLSTMPPDTHLACAGCDETLGTLEACAPRKAYASDLTKHRPSQCSSVLLTRKSFAGRKGFFFAKSSRSSRLSGESWAGLHREGAKHAKKTLRTLVWLRLCCSVFIGGC